MTKSRASKATLAALGLAAAIALQGCSNGPKVSHDLDEKVSKETVANRAELRHEDHKVVAGATGATAKQKAQLKQVRDELRAKTDALTAQSLKLRSLLVHEVIAQNSNADEIAQLKRRIQDVSQDRLSAVFKAVHEANSIMGRWESKNERTTDQTLDDMTTDMSELR